MLNFIKIQKINGTNLPMYAYQYNDDIDDLIQKIMSADKNTTIRIYDDLLNKAISVTKNIEKITTSITRRIDGHSRIKDSIWMAFFKAGNLDDSIILDILRHTRPELSAMYLCLPHECMTPSVRFAIDNIDHLPFFSMKEVVDLSQMPDFVLTELFPCWYGQIISDDEHNFFLQKVDNNNLIFNLVEKDRLSQNQLVAVCNNTNINSPVRNQAFDLLENVHLVSLLTPYMKESLYESFVYTVFD